MRVRLGVGVRVRVRVRLRVRLCVREGEGAPPRATEHEPPLLDAQVLPQTLDVLHEVWRRVGDEGGAQVVGRVGLGVGDQQCSNRGKAQRRGLR